MKISIDQAKNRYERILCWTDKINGYLQLSSDGPKKTDGYYRGNKRLISGFCLNGRNWNEGIKTDVYPEGFRAEFENCFIELSLLIYEQAFFISADKSLGLLSVVEESENIHSQWTKIEKNGIHILSHKSGVAIAAEFDFQFSLYSSNLVLMTSNIISCPNPFESKGYYLVFELDEEIGIQKAHRLVQNKGINVHRQKINDFLNKAEITSPDVQFNEAFQWARFHGWMLSVKDENSDYRGIWAGLPWFRDNWGRDTFIALSGILLVSGNIEEAGEVLKGFAGFQDLCKDSPTYGRIPNRYRDKNDVIYNTVDGTLYFIRALWEWTLYSGDDSLIKQLSSTVKIALDADIERCDSYGFLLHGDADTWMDARIDGNQPWSPRGDSANDIQALWWTALKIGAKIMSKLNDEEKVEKYEKAALKVKNSFNQFFWNKKKKIMADCLPPKSFGAFAKDFRIRPNQLFTISVPAVIDDEEFLDSSIEKEIVRNCERDLLNPFGLYSLAPSEKEFHPHHENLNLYHKDAAYHNGTIWEWNTGAYISSVSKLNAFLPARGTALLLNEAKMILNRGACGSLSENIHAATDINDQPILSGTFSQAWSVSEFCRNIIQNVTGFSVNLIFGDLKIKPCLPVSVGEWKAKLPFGKASVLKVKIQQVEMNYLITAQWNCSDLEEAKKQIKLNGNLLKKGEEIQFCVRKNYLQTERALEFKISDKWITEPFFVHNLLSENCGSIHQKNFLKNLILSGKYQRF